MNINQIKTIENCFNPNHICDMSNLTPATDKEYNDFLKLMDNYKQDEHVKLFWFLQNSGAFDGDIPF